MAVERNLLILPAIKTVPNPSLGNGKQAIEQFIAKLKLPGYEKADGKERIAVVDAVYALNKLEERNNTVGAHMVLRKPAPSEANNAGFFSSSQGMTETALNGIIASYLEDPKRQIEENKTHLRHDLKELWGFMELNSLYVFTAAAVYDFSRHDFLGGYNEVRTKTNGSETIFDSVAYADAGGNRVYVFNLELSPLEATSRKDGGLLVVSNVSVGAKEMVEYAAKALREVFPGVVGIWTSDQPSR